MSTPNPALLSEGDRNRLSSAFALLGPDLMEGWTTLKGVAESTATAGAEIYLEALSLAARICSFSLVPGNSSHPFRGIFEGANGHSQVLDQLTERELRLIEEMSNAAPAGHLAGRLNDLAWHCLRPRNPNHAVKAIENYRSIPINEQIWISGGREACYRAIQLARMIGGRSGNALDNIRVDITDAFHAASAENGYLAVWLADALHQHRFQDIDPSSVADHLSGIARDWETAGNYVRAVDYFEVAAQWYRVAGNEGAELDAIIATADMKCNEADQRLAGEGVSHMAAASFIEDAVLVLRRVPTAHRSRLGVDRRLEDLERKLAEHRQAATGELHEISTGPADVTHIVRDAQERVRGKSLPEAIKALAMLGRIEAIADRERDAEAQLRASPLMAFMGGRVVGRDGRIVAVRPGYNQAQPDSEDSRTARFAQMVQTHLFMVGLRVQARILPALDVIRSEHAVAMQVLHRLCMQSPIVPSDRAGLIARGLHYGFEGDWVAATHVLVPQVEHLVRLQLKSVGTITTSMDPSGVTNEVGLSTLMSQQEADTVLGPELAFEVRALFCSHFGPNLRNEIAHGLLGDDDFDGAGSVYAWWFVLFLVKQAWLHREMAAPATEDADVSSGED
jgi:hypothetical protein